MVTRLPLVLVTNPTVKANDVRELIALAKANPGKLNYASTGLGTHLTIDLAGQARFGPDVEWVDRIAYEVDPRRGESFYAAIRRYWPDLPDGALQPGYSGIRPKIVPPDAPAQDFVVQGRATHGVPGLVNLFGIESPGLTASLALAEHVLEVAAQG